MQDNQVDQVQKAEHVEKKPYAAPQLTRHGKIEDLTQLLPNPSPSQGVPPG